MKAVLLLAILVAAPSAASSVGPYTRYPLSDLGGGDANSIARVGLCGDYAPNPNGPCNVTLLKSLCDGCSACVAFNTNGWLKRCGNESCGAALAPNNRVDTYISGDGSPAPPSPPPPVPPVADIDDAHYPPEEAAERAAAPVPAATAIGDGWAVLAPAGGGAAVNVSLGGVVAGYALLATLPSLPPGAVAAAVLERVFARWGLLVFLTTSGEAGRLRHGTGSAYNLTMPNYGGLAGGGGGNSTCGDDDYYARVYANASDWIAGRIAEDAPDGEASFLGAAKYLPPQRDYASIGGVRSYVKWSVAPDGRIKAADGAIYVPGLAINSTGPGTLIWDPARFLPPASVPASNYSVQKSSLLGRVLRVVATAAWEPALQAGFEQLAFAPDAVVNSSALVRLRAVGSGGGGAPSYYSASRSGVEPVGAAAFYAALWIELQSWNTTLSGTTAYRLPGQQGARQADTAIGALVASMSLFIGDAPNYGDGEDYWSPQIERGGSLPFQEIALAQNLLDVGMAAAAAARVGYWFDNFIRPNGAIDTGDWETSCPFGFADGFADLGEMQDLFARTARAALGFTANGSAWLSAHLPAAIRLANYSLGLRVAARRNASAVGPERGLVWGPPEHDTCHSPGYYYHNNAWLVRGMREMGRFLTDACPSLCPALVPFGAALLSEADTFATDFGASLALTLTPLPNGAVFVPPIAALGVKPFASMIESTLSEYANFRYYSELLGAAVLPRNVSVGLQLFRESTTGTVSGITRWSDHLDDMPSSYYLAAALRDDRINFFLLLLYGHLANYQGRGTFTATEQLPIVGDANGWWRDYLWSYLEGGIDQCVPSIMLPAIGTRWQLVYEVYDADVIYLARGAPRRWATPADGGYGVNGATTRFGSVDLAVEHTTRSDGGEDATAGVTFTPATPIPGAPAPPLTFVLRLRSSFPRGALAPASVALSGTGVVLASIDALRGDVYVNATTLGTPLAFTVSATLAAAA